MPELQSTHEIFQRYYDSLVASQRADSTLHNNRIGLRYASEFLDRKKLTAEKAKQAHWKEFLLGFLIGERGHAPSTAAKYFKAVRAAYTEAFKLGDIKGNPTTGVLKFLPKREDELPQFFTNEELRRIYEVNKCGGDYSAPWQVIDERKRLCFYLSAFAGMRVHEIQEIWTAPHDLYSFIDWDERQIVVRGKGGKIRFVPIHAVLWDVLARYRHPDPYMPNLGTCRPLMMTQHHKWCGLKQISRDYRAMVDAAGLQHFEQTSYAFRKSLATSLSRNDVRPDLIEQILGWAPRTVRGRFYTGRVSADVHQAIARAYADDPIIPEQTRYLAQKPQQVDADESERELLEMKLEAIAAEKELLAMRIEAAKLGVAA